MLTRLRAKAKLLEPLATGVVPLALAIAVGGLALLLGARFGSAVRSEGHDFAAKEFAALAEHAIAAAEAPVDAATRALNQLSRSAPLSCSETTLSEFRRTLAAVPAIGNLGLVDLSGRLMCSTKGQEGPDALLPPLSPRAPIVLLLADPRSGRVGLIVGWTPSSGPRLIAEMAADMPALPDFPAFATGKSAIVIGPSEGGVWRRRGAEAFSLGTNPESVSVRGAAFPLVARVEWQAEFVPEPFLHVAAWAGGVGWGLAFFIAMAVGAAWLAWWKRPVPVATADAGPPSYRAVIEIDTGRLVGIDLAVSDAEAAAGIGVERLGQILIDAAPLLTEWPSLKLSLPVSRSVVDRPAERDRLMAILQQTLIDPDQLVATLDTGRNPRRLDAIAGLLRGLRRTGMQVALTGPGDSLQALLRTKPDFVWLNNPLGGTSGDERLARVATIRALADAAQNTKTGVLARSIGDPESLETLRQIGIITATGPVFGSAMPASAMAEIARAAAAPVLDAQAAAG